MVLPLPLCWHLFGLCPCRLQCHDYQQYITTGEFTGGLLCSLQVSLQTGAGAAPALLPVQLLGRKGRCGLRAARGYCHSRHKEEMLPCSLVCTGQEGEVRPEDLSQKQ